MAHADKKHKERTPKTPDGIFDMIGPRTLDGGYSASQYMSSAIDKDVLCLVTNVGAVRIGLDESGLTKACDMAATRAMIRNESFDIIAEFY
jgi:hypothetical protein